jgi:60 kDa SS-A/Ro ribonucleoprotein
MIHALREKIEVDTFIIYSGDETWAGEIRPCPALQEYGSRFSADLYFGGAR